MEPELLPRDAPEDELREDPEEERDDPLEILLPELPDEDLKLLPDDLEGFENELLLLPVRVFDPLDPVNALNILPLELPVL